MRRLLNVCGGQMSHEKKQQGICRNVQIEIDEAMHEEAAASDKTGELQGPGKRIVELAQALHGLGQQDADKPDAAKATGYARLCETLEIVVVCVIDCFPVVERFIRRKNRLEGAKSCPQKRMIEKDPPSVGAHGGTLACSHLENLYR